MLKKIEKKIFILKDYKLYFLTLLIVCQNSYSAQVYPNKSIRIIVPYSAGGGTDTITRIVAAGLQEKLLQSVVVDNRGGANGIIGIEIVANSHPDGYTLLSCTTALATNVSLYKGKTSYDPIMSFSPISLIVQSTLMLVINPSLPVRNLKELISHIKNKPDELTYSSYGIGSSPHLAAVLFTSMSNLNMTHIPFKGGAPAITEIIAGRVTMTFSTISSVYSHLQSGKIKPIAVATLERNLRFKEIPTLSESGLPGFEAAGGWTGVCAPHKTPKEKIAKLNTYINIISSAEENQRKFLALGYEIFPSLTPEDFSNKIKKEVIKWSKVINDFNIKPE
jgi:tripartite-type tricarboxylate transporter receptor subunit TctC